MFFCSNNNLVHVYILTRVVVCVDVSVFQVERPTGIILLVEELAVLSTNNIFVHEDVFLIGSPGVPTCNVQLL